MKDKYDDDDDAEMDARLMDELIDAMSGRDADAMKPQAPGAGHVIEIHIKPGGMESPEAEPERREGMLPDPDELKMMMKKGMK